MNLDDLFIAPPNALQFHIQRSHIGKQSEACWVLPVALEVSPDDSTRLPGCTCSVWFRLINHSNPVVEEARAKFESEGRFMYVCACYGSVVE